MSAGATVAISTTRVRAISVASGALVVALVCLILLAFSRVITELEQATIEGVQVEILQREEPQRAPLRSRPLRPQHTTDASAAPAITPIPVDRAMFARTLRCFDLRIGEQRPPECPPVPQRQLQQAGGTFPSDPQRDPRDLMTNADRNLEAFMDVGPCQGVCIPIGITPPPPSRSPLQICVDGGVGPCGTPIFRADEVERLAHTQ